MDIHVHYILLIVTKTSHHTDESKLNDHTKKDKKYMCIQNIPTVCTYPRVAGIIIKQIRSDNMQLCDTNRYYGGNSV